MNKILVAVFDSEDAAFNGLTALKQLHQYGDITLYDSAVVAKNRDGFAAIQKQPDNPPTGTVVGLFLGALVGALAGPVGVGVGAATGTLAGATRDIIHDDADYGFVEEIRDSMLPGKAAVVAEIEEIWTTPVDVALGERGAMVFRRLKHEVVEDQLARESSEFEAELQDLKDELARSTGNVKAAIEARIALVQKSIKQTNEAATARAKRVEAEWHAKLQAMDQQLKDANALRRKRLEDQRNKAKAQYETRMAKLREAQHLVREALTL